MVSRKTTTTTATRLTTMKSSSVVQRQDVSRSQQEVGETTAQSSGESQSVYRYGAVREASSRSMESRTTSSSTSREKSSLISVGSRAALSAKIDAKLNSRTDADDKAGPAIAFIETDAQAVTKAKLVENNQASASKSSSTEEKRSTSISFTSRREQTSSRFSSFTSKSTTSRIEIGSGSASKYDTSLLALPGAICSRGPGDDKSWYYELLERLENLRWNYQNLEAEYAFLEKLMAEQKQDLKKAQSWAQSMRRHGNAADDFNRVALS